LNLTGKDLDRERVWVFGLVERSLPDQVDDSKCYLQVVDDREAKTLISIIYDKCVEGTTIFSDCWSSYQKIKEFKNFNHQTVNHSLNFIDPNTGTCTNRIESIWNACKTKFKEMRGCGRFMIQSYIDEYIWRFNNKVTTDRKAAYFLILSEIAKFYKPGTT
jgi:transposase-like protein